MSDQLPENLQKLLYKGATDTQIQLIRTVYARKALPNGFVPVFECEDLCSPYHWAHISFGCIALDRLMRNGGISVRGITEICGAAGVGKSQLCLQLALMVQLPVNLGGLGKGAVFICSEGAFPSKRLYQLIRTFQSLYKQSAEHVQFSNNIFIEHVADFKQLRDCVANRLPVLLRSNSIGLVVVDSVGAIFRPDANVINRAGDMREFAHILVGLSSQHGCAVVCVNQVSAMMDVSGENRLKPALGLAWANLVSTRIKIHRTRRFHDALTNGTPQMSGDSIDDSQTLRVTVRQMEMVFSPEVEPGLADFLILPEGLSDLPCSY